MSDGSGGDESAGFSVDESTDRDGESSDRDGERADDAAAELFEETAVEELDSDRVWAQLQSDETDPSGRVQGRNIREFDKRSYCHRCPHFSEPPAVRCAHEGTTILELVDVRTFRVANCPVVLEEESLEDS